VSFAETLFVHSALIMVAAAAKSFLLLAVALESLDGASAFVAGARSGAFTNTGLLKSTAHGANAAVRMSADADGVSRGDCNA
jgi:hypothetical protein